MDMNTLINIVGSSIGNYNKTFGVGCTNLIINLQIDDNLIDMKLHIHDFCRFSTSLGRLSISIMSQTVTFTLYY